MKIEKVEVAWLSLESPEPQGLSGGYMTHSSDAVCRITTDDGIQGIGDGRGASLPQISAVVHPNRIRPLAASNDDRSRHGSSGVMSPYPREVSVTIEK